MILIILLIYVILALAYLWLMHRHWLLNPAPLWVLAQLTFFLGTVPLMNWDIEADRAYIVSMIVGLGFFIVGALAICLNSDSKEATIWLSSPIRHIESSVTFDRKLWAIVTVSVGVSLMYFAAVGYNLFLDGILALARGTGSLGDDVAGLRLEAYAGSQYFAPGYVNQFKNVLLPLAIGFLCARNYLSSRNRRTNTMLLGLLVLLSVILLLGTGQRGPFVLAAAVTAAFFAAVLPARRARRILVVLLMSGVGLFSITSLILGRTTSQIAGMADISAVATELLARVSGVNQETGLIGFRYVYGLSVQNGADWVQSLISLVPGHQPQIGLAQEVYFVMFGTTRGTAPVSIWGSIWYNFGAIGIVVFPFLLGLLYQGVFQRLVRGPKTLFRLLLYSAAYVYLGTWVAGGPVEYLANVGLITIVFLGILMAVRFRTRPKGVMASEGRNL